MASKPKVECEHCRSLVSNHMLLKHHGAGMPRCVSSASIREMYERDEALAGKSKKVLLAADVGRFLPMLSLRWVANPEPSVGPTGPRYTKEEFLLGQYVAPRWSVLLASSLMTDQHVIEKFGHYKVQKRSPSPYSWRANELRKQGRDPNKALVIPLELRARIIRAAATNGIVRELLADDLEAALLIIGGQL